MGGVVEAEGDEAAVFVEGVAEAEGVAFEVRPVGAEGVGGHAEDEDAGVFEAVFDLGGDVVAGLDLPEVEPDVDAVRAEAFGDGAHDVVVVRAVAQEHVVFEFVSHASPLRPRYKKTGAGGAGARRQYAPAARASANSFRPPRVRVVRPANTIKLQHGGLRTSVMIFHIQRGDDEP
ncbi:MAG TPA: hypothetical protein VF546_15245 [Pyrinomonadaceae bacterium]